MLEALASAIPGWLGAGLALGGLLVVVVTVIFVVGSRRFPEPQSSEAGTEHGEARRVIEIRNYLRSINESFIEDLMIAGRLVAFYLPDRDLAITFDAHDYFVLDRVVTHAVLVEYEMPGDAIGNRLPFETPPMRPSAADRGVEAALSTLGLSASATDEEVRAAYRERIKDAHPDHGGDQATFERVREAYTVARNRAD